MMPAILPNVMKCSLGPEKCKTSQHLVSRSDDTEETISTRFEVFEKSMSPILEFYRSKNLLKEFIVKKGIDDSDDLIKLIQS